MSPISQFYGIAIQMYPGYSLPPHFRAQYQHHEAVFDLSGNLLSGVMPKKERCFIGAWALLHGPELKADWAMVMSNLEPLQIRSLS